MEFYPPEWPEEKTDDAARPLSYAGAWTPTPETRRMHMAVGMGIGVGIVVLLATIWWPIGGSMVTSFFVKVATVPLLSLAIAVVLRVVLGWRGVVAGVLLTFALLVLIPGLTLLVVCGVMR